MVRIVWARIRTDGKTGVACSCRQGEANMRKLFDEAQVIGFLRELDAGQTLRELCRKHGFSDASQVLLRRICGGPRAPHASHVRRLQVENRQLKALLDAQLLERERVRQALREQL
jgi:putative transposase